MTNVAGRRVRISAMISDNADVHTTSSWGFGNTLHQSETPCSAQTYVTVGYHSRIVGAGKIERKGKVLMCNGIFIYISALNNRTESRHILSSSVPLLCSFPLCYCCCPRSDK